MFISFTMYSMLLFLYTLLDFCSAIASADNRLTLAIERVPKTGSILRRDANSSGTAEVEAINNGTDWVTSITIGGQVLRVQIATALDSTWVLSSRADAETRLRYGTHKFYNDSISSTSKPNVDLLWNATVNNENDIVSGIGATDTVNIGGLEVENMLFGMASTVGIISADISKNIDGVLGLARGPTNTDFAWIDTSGRTGKLVQEQTFLQRIQDELAEGVFTCNFRANQPETISFGFVNSSLYTGTLNELAVNQSKAFWLVNGASASSSGASLSNSSLPILFDTAAQGTTLDKPTVQAYWALVPGSQLIEGSEWVFPCNTTTLPDLSLTFPSGAVVDLPGSALNETAYSFDGVTCIGGLQQVDHFSTLNIGNAFFGKYFTVWNFTAPSISFAPYSDVQDTSGTNVANLPTATDAAGAPKATGVLTTTSSAASPSPTKSAAGFGLNMAAGSAYRLLLSLFAATVLVLAL